MTSQCKFVPRWKTLLFFVAIIAIVACAKSLTPDAQVRAAIAQAETAAEKKDIGALKGLISDKYSDSQGQDKRAVESVLRFVLLRNESVYLLTRVHAISFPEKDRALAVVTVAMAGQPVKSAQELERVRANLYRFEFTWAREADQWRVWRAEWRPAEIGDFL